MKTAKQPTAELQDNKTILVHSLTYFDIEKILKSGQVFRYFQIEGGWRIITGNNSADIFIKGNSALIHSDNAKFFFDYFDFTTDYAIVRASFTHHAKLSRVWALCGGIRILRGEFAETAISFILSANNNIKRFTKTLNLMCEKAGEKLKCNTYGFPALKSLAKLTEPDFRALGCGYRSRYLVNAVAQLQTAEFNFNALNALPNDLLYKKLRNLVGVGDKVARCIMLFAFHRLNIVPVDTWIERAYKKVLNKPPVSGNGKPLSPRKMAQEFSVFFGEYAGVAQQEIFYYMQHLKKEL